VVVVPVVVIVNTSTITVNFPTIGSLIRLRLILTDLIGVRAQKII